MQEELNITLDTAKSSLEKVLKISDLIVDEIAPTFVSELKTLCAPQSYHLVNQGMTQNLTVPSAMSFDPNQGGLLKLRKDLKLSETVFRLAYKVKGRTGFNSVDFQYSKPIKM